MFNAKVSPFAMILILICGTLCSAQAGPPPLIDVFASGQDGYHTFRIPSVLRTSRGTLLAFAEGRKSSGSDAGDIDLVLKRSGDGGRSWSALQTVWDDAGNTCGNPCPVVDRATGVILLLMTHNLGADKESQIQSRTSRGSRTVWISRSEDDGLSWSTPAEITASVKRPEWTWYATGPGIGIQLRSGRLLIPCDNAVAGSRAFQSHVIYSDDHGKTWSIGGVLGPQVNECQAAELSDGSVLINMRSYRRQECRAVARSSDGGLTFSAISDDKALVDPVCQASLISYPDGAAAKQRSLAFSNPADPKKRARMTLRLSDDDGRTWPHSRLIYAGSAGYSCLVPLPDGLIGCLFERDGYQKISLARLSAAQLRGN